jgi:hypothetical protein
MLYRLSTQSTTKTSSTYQNQCRLGLALLKKSRESKEMVVSKQEEFERPSGACFIGTTWSASLSVLKVPETIVVFVLPYKLMPDTIYSGICSVLGFYMRCSIYQRQCRIYSVFQCPLANHDVPRSEFICRSDAHSHE